MGEWQEDETPEQEESRKAREAQLREELIGVGFPELLADQCLSLFDSSKLKWAFCPDCRRKVQVEVADTTSQLKAMELALNHVIGKPKERQEIKLTVSQKPLHEMTMAEKQQYLIELKQLELNAPGK